MYRISVYTTRFQRPSLLFHPFFTRTTSLQDEMQASEFGSSGVTSMLWRRWSQSKLDDSLQGAYPSAYNLHRNAGTPRILILRSWQRWRTGDFAVVVASRLASLLSFICADIRRVLHSPFLPLLIKDCFSHPGLEDGVAWPEFSCSQGGRQRGGRHIKRANGESRGWRNRGNPHRPPPRQGHYSEV